MRVPVVLSSAFIAVATLATLAVPAVRDRVVDTLHLRDDPAEAGPILPDGRMVGHGDLRIARQPAPPRLTLAARAVSVAVTPGTFFAWALLERRTGRIHGSPNHTTEQTSTESMIKAWIAADYLRGLGTRQPSQQRLTELTTMIRDSDDNAAEDIYTISGRDRSIGRMISTCGLTDTALHSAYWSYTMMTARDAVRLGLCVADGRAAGPRWTAWIVGEMRQVRGGVAEEPGGGRWGIIDGLPPDLARDTGIKNGWTLIYADGQWHLNCLAVHPDFVLAVLTRYPAALGKQYGANLCRQVAEQLVTKV